MKTRTRNLKRLLSLLLCLCLVTGLLPVTVLAADAPAQPVLDALVQAGALDNVLLDPAPSAVITEYGECGVRYSLRVWVNNADYWDVTYALNQRIKDIFDSQGIALAYPHRIVRLENIIAPPAAPESPSPAAPENRR